MRAVLSPELSRPDFALAVHGGVAAAGRDRIDGEWAEACRQALALALSEGRKILAAGGAALDAVTAAVCVLEDDPHFDAGRGDLAAATSTGGITGKAPGRVGDSPIIGAGTYADNESCAVSATGLGEVFLRAGAAFEVAARLKHAGQSLADAAAAALDAVAAMGGAGGVIAVDNKGALAMPFRDCAGIYRGYVRSDGEIHTAIWDEDRVEG
jgi:isoaspartyl peptidase/L-asparaginase-like protein (Ntn-hydrolase superfamily)